MLTRHKFVILLLFSCLAWQPLYADEIVIAADQWCPYNCVPNDDRPGYVVEVARLIFEEAGHTLTYKTMPWERALQSGIDGSVTAVIAVSDEPEGEQLIKPEEPMGLYQVVFFTHRDSNWNYDGIDSLRDQRIGIIGGYAYFPAFDEYIETHPERLNVNRGNDALARNIEMIQRGRLDVTLDDRSVAQYTLRKMDIGDEIRDAGMSETVRRLYLAFSPQHPGAHDYAELWTTGVRRLRETGTLQEILNKYNVTDWVGLWPHPEE